MELIMTDFQYKSLIKMAIKIVQKSKTKEEAEEELTDLIREKKEDDNRSAASSES